jgi:hypothetical protein
MRAASGGWRRRRGKPELAQAGGKRPTQNREALDHVPANIAETLK